MLNPADCTLFSGAANGAEAEFGLNAERHGIDEVNFTFEGHNDARTRGIRVLTHEELRQGDVSLRYVSKLMQRSFPDTPLFRMVLQSIWYQVNSGQEIFVVGVIQPDTHVKGGTGWGAEFAKLCNKPLHVFDQQQNGWFTWDERQWVARTGNDLPRIEHIHFTGTGTRTLTDDGARLFMTTPSGIRMFVLPVPEPAGSLLVTAFVAGFARLRRGRGGSSGSPAAMASRWRSKSAARARRSRWCTASRATAGSTGV